MKYKLLFCTILFFAIFSGQTKTDSIVARSKESYNKVVDLGINFRKFLTYAGKTKMDEIISENSKVVDAYNDYCDNIMLTTNRDVEKVISKKIMEKYGDYFTLDGQSFIYSGYNDKEEKVQRLLLGKGVMYSNMKKRVYALIDQAEKERNEWVNKSLKRHGITREKFDAMNENDQAILLSEFAQEE